MTRLFDADKYPVTDRVQVNIPFSWLMEGDWLNTFLENRLNPEIGLDAAALDNWSLTEFDAIARRFHESGRTITLHGPFLDLSPGSPDPAIRSVTQDRLNQLVEAVDAFKPLTVVCHAGYDGTRYGFIRETWYENAIETWSRMGSQLADKGVRLMLENVYEMSPDELREIFEQLDTRHAGCCLDVGHLSVFSHVPAGTWIETLSPYIGQIHLHDNYRQSDLHVGLGKGAIDFSPVFEWLRSTPRHPVITLEPHREADLLASIAFLENRKWFQ